MKKIRSCDYCTFALKKRNNYGLPWIPPQMEEYYCARTHKDLGRRTNLSRTPSWCPLLREMER